MTNETHLITGGLGFIGNELSRQLRLAGKRVVIIDNRNRTAPKIDDLDDTLVHEIEINDKASVSRVIAAENPRVVYHLAAIHFIPECNSDPERTIRVNVEGTLVVLRACAEAGVSRICFASSGAVYADSSKRLVENALVEPVDIYGQSKLFGEELCRLASRRDGLAIVACRLFNNYGARETNPHIIPEILRQVRYGNVLRLGNVDTRRDYIDTRDTAHCLHLLMDRATPGLEIVNVASGRDASVRELVGLIGELLGRRLEILSDPGRVRAVDKAIQIADISRLRQLAGWAPDRSLREGVKDLLRFEGLLACQ